MKQLGTVLVLLLSAMTLVACSGMQAEPSQLQKDVVRQQLEAKTIEFSCDAACSLTYNDPNRRIHMPNNTSGYDVVNNVINKTFGFATHAAVPAALAIQGIELGKAGFDALKGSGETNTRVTNTTTNTEIGDNSGDGSGTTSESTDFGSSVGAGNSGNIYNDTPGRVDSDDNNDGRFDSDNNNPAPEEDASDGTDTSGDSNVTSPSGDGSFGSFRNR